VDTRQLAAFVAVVERGSFSIAADDLGVTQPAVSLAVRSLEKRLGARLLDRSGRQVAPTAAGRAVLIRAQRMLALEQELADTLRAEADTVGGHLAIGASTGVIQSFNWLFWNVTSPTAESVSKTYSCRAVLKSRATACWRRVSFSETMRPMRSSCSTRHSYVRVMALAKWVFWASKSV